MYKLVAIHVYEPAEHDELVLRDADVKPAEQAPGTDVADQWAALEWERFAEHSLLSA